mgnify:CR=1 FL=1
MENLHLKNLKNNGKITIKKITRYFDDRNHMKIAPDKENCNKIRNIIDYVYPPRKLTKIQKLIDNQTLIIYYNYYYEKIK